MASNLPATRSSIAAIRARAKQHLEDGAVTEGYGADRQAVLTLLNEALATELVCTLRYRRHYFMAQGVLAEGIKKEFLVHAVEEQGHADQIAERIVQLGGEPDFDPDTLTRRSHAEYVAGETLEEMIREDLIAERIAIESYREMIDSLASHDPTTRRMLESILAVEEEHAEELASMIDGVRQMTSGQARSGQGDDAKPMKSAQPQQPANRLDAAIKDPTTVFASPREVVEDKALSVDDKRRILVSWIKDSELLATATAENMNGGEEPRLRESKLALASLDAPAAAR